MACFPDFGFSKLIRSSTWFRVAFHQACRLPSSIKAIRSQERGAKLWTAGGFVRWRQPATERVNTNCRKAFRLTFEDDEVRTNR